MFFVLPTFNMDIIQEEGSSEQSVLNVTATFALVYLVDSFEGVSDVNLEAFSLTNGIFNAWPYWREFVQNTVARMGIQGSITVPVFRIGDNPLRSHVSEINPSNKGAERASATTEASTR
jgi:hypothetical protein